jgi:hypothetical protein
MNMKALLSAMTSLALAACATTTPDSESGANRKPEQNRKMVRTTDCVFQSSISGFNALDNRYVVLYSGGSRTAYLVEVFGGCFDVKNQSTLAAVDGDGNGQICGFGRDSLAYREFGRIEQCRILSMEKLSDLRRYEVLGESPPTRRDKKDEDQDDDAEEDEDAGE